VKCIFALILVLIIFKHIKYTIRKNCVDMCPRHGREAIEIYLSEKGALAKKRWETLHYMNNFQRCKKRELTTVENQKLRCWWHLENTLLVRSKFRSSPLWLSQNDLWCVQWSKLSVILFS